VLAYAVQNQQDTASLVTRDGFWIGCDPYSCCDGVNRGIVATNTIRINLIIIILVADSGFLVA
jgi:hypothetical protein